MSFQGKECFRNSQKPWSVLVKHGKNQDFMAQRKVSSRKISQLFQLTCSDKVPMSNMNPGPASTPILSETKKKH